jgi:hypothetical protein
MRPLGIETIWGSPWHFTLFIRFQVIFYFHSLSQPFASSTIIVICTIKLHFPPLLLISRSIKQFTFSPFVLPSYIFSTSTMCLQFLNLYFTMARGKLTPIFTPNTLEFMIEYTLISSILDRICEMTPG